MRGRVAAINIFQRILKGKEQPTHIERAELMNGSTAQFTAWSGDAYANDTYRGAVDAIARNAAKLKGSHIVNYSDRTRVYPDGKLNRLLQVQPNPYMSAFDMLYKLITHYYLYNMTAGAIGAEMGMSESAVRTNESAALRSLRRSKASRQLQSYIEERTPYFMSVGVTRFKSTHCSAVEEVVMLRERLMNA